MTVITPDHTVQVQFPNESEPADLPLRSFTGRIRPEYIGDVVFLYRKDGVFCSVSLEDWDLIESYLESQGGA
jgi:hypothetical protein